jgi:hypothetical protein
MRPSMSTIRRAPNWETEPEKAGRWGLCSGSLVCRRRGWPRTGLEASTFAAALSPLRPGSRSDRASRASSSPRARATSAAPRPPVAIPARTAASDRSRRRTASQGTSARTRPRRASRGSARGNLHPARQLLREPLLLVPARVHEHVGDRVPHLPRTGQHAQVIPIGEHLPLSPERVVHRAPDARSHPRRNASSIASTTSCRRSDSSPSTTRQVTRQG